MIPSRTMLVRILTVLHSALGRWLARADQPAVPKRKARSWFDLPPGMLDVPSDPDEEVAERRRRNTIRIGRPRP